MTFWVKVILVNDFCFNSSFNYPKDQSTYNIFKSVKYSVLYKYIQGPLHLKAEAN